MEKESYKKWLKIGKKREELDPNIDANVFASLMTNQEEYIKKTILDVAKENLKKGKKKNGRRKSSKRNGKN